MDQHGNSHDHSLSDEARARLHRFKAYATSHTVLSEVAKELKRAIAEPAGFAYVLLYGPSGVGKTTLIRQMERTCNASPRVSEPHSPYVPVPLLLLETLPLTARPLTVLSIGVCPYLEPKVGIVC